jgi:hypothetical protein
LGRKLAKCVILSAVNTFRELHPFMERKREQYAAAFGGVYVSLGS